ncbi:MAG: S1/P1 nuclease [Sphingomonas sp.]|uniref:S1/P1 nuclease n=1 Tax=Sphingomonas sp. TaxID=28214 RepID=UPI0025EA2618|nr:S1/P1 nuclease [Sphingomonas sp.]MBX9880919.1 S1/P1 nuclease [Sphingomonas sp.]
MIRFIAALLALIASAPVQAYGQFGHNTIARIAFANVKPQTRVRLVALLAKGGALATPECQVRTIEDASTWPDCIRARYPLRFGYSSPWHYQTLDICGDFDLKAACRDGNCVSAQIERNVKLLQEKDTPLAERVQALAFLVHFVGDLHMPLHSGSHNDQGGNALRASYGDYAPDRLNLHGIWDGVLAERAITDGPNLVRRYPDAEAAPLQAGTVADWSRESYEAARDVAYPGALGADYCRNAPPARLRLGEAAIASAVPVQRLQVQRAGLRLARLLDEAFG